MKISSLNLYTNRNYIKLNNVSKQKEQNAKLNTDLGLNSLAFYGKTGVVRALSEDEIKKSEEITEFYGDELDLTSILEENNVARVMLKKLSAEDIKNNINSSVEAFENYGIEQSDWLSFCKKAPCLLAFDGEHALNYSIKGVCEDKFFKPYGLTEEKYIQMAKKVPRLFYQNPETIKKNVQEITNDEYFIENGLTEKEYINAVVQEPNLLCRNAATIKRNIQNIVNDEYFSGNGLNAKNYLKAAIKQPALFYQTAESVKNNIRSVEKDEYFIENELIAKDYIKAALRVPALFCMNSETIKKNILDIVNDKYFAENGLNAKDYIHSAIKAPTLFYSNAETIKNNVQSVVNNEYLKDNGLTISSYMKALKNLPQLFYQNPQTVIANIKGVTEDEYMKENGLNAKDYINAAKKQSSLFAQRPETIKEHIKIYHLMELDKLHECEKNPTGNEIANIINNKNLVYGSENLYLRFLKSKIFPTVNLTPKELRGNYNMVEKMTRYMREVGKNEPETVIPLSIVKHEKTNDFIDFLTKFSLDNTGHNSFNVTII